MTQKEFLAWVYWIDERGVAQIAMIGLFFTFLSFVLVWAGLAWFPALEASSILAIMSIVVFRTEFKRVRGERDATQCKARWALQDVTKKRCADTFSAIEARGVRWLFYLDAYEGKRACGTCKEQIISLDAYRRYQPVPSAPHMEINQWMGDYCPRCGQPQGSTNPIAGDLQAALCQMEKRGDIYRLDLLCDIPCLRLRIHVLESSVARREADNDDDIREIVELRERLALEELKDSTSGYRIAAKRDDDVAIAPEDEQPAEEEPQLRRPGLSVGTDFVG